MSLPWLDAQEVHLPYNHSLVLHLLILSSIFIFIYKLRSRNAKRQNLPPSPSKLPILGNLHQVGSSPHRGLHTLAQKYGSIMLLYLGQVPTLVVSSASMAEQIMKTHDLVCSSRPNNSSIVRRLLYEKDIGFAPYNEYWRQVRKICILELLSVKKVQAFRFVMEEETKVMVKMIKNTKGLVNLSDMMVFLTNGIICRIALGKKYGGNENRKRYKEMIKEFGILLGVFDVGSLVPWLSWVNNISGLNERVESNFRDIDEFLDEVIEDHIRKRDVKKIQNSGGNEDEEEDFVDVLLGIEQENTIGVPFAKVNIKAIVLDMFAAGTDTTYAIIEWAMAELLRNPEIMKEVQEEVREILKGKSEITDKDIIQMPYLQAVIKETFRLHPPAPLIPRESTEDIKIEGYDIPAQTTILINAFAIGRDPASWEDPEAYRPNRFLNGIGSVIDYKGLHYQLIPFGGGRRGCPGIQLGMATVELALASLLNKFGWELPNGLNNEDLDMVEGSGLTIHKKSPLLLIAKPYKY